MTDTTHAALVKAMARAMCLLPKPEDAADVLDMADAALSALRTARPDIAALLDGEAVAVPREATDAMLWAADKEPYPVGVQDNPDMPGFVSFALARAEYRAMLAASPWSKRDE